ncbi:MAG TPA: cation-transporting P-type ATPase [Ilumatobacteraceae bacterium]|nr:cation-transporting P-type ATPase [Ilumatobacteraceae bacterium]
MTGGTVLVDRAGLSEAEASARLTTEGSNLLPATRRPSSIKRFAKELVHFFALMLWVAAVLAWIAGLPALTVAIAAVVVVNALFAFIQERRADKAADRLRVLLPTQVTVRRAGHRRRIEANEVVPGDVLLLEAGDRVPADGTALASDGLLLDTSMLTGESESTRVEPGAALFAGTFVVEGEGEAVVDATGARTRLAHIAALTSSATKPDTPLTRELTRVVRTVAFIALGVGVGFFLLAWSLGYEADDGFVFAIGVTVALVPEALLPTVTLSLAWGAEKMADRQVLVRNLEAVETLGSTTFICTDKTGTLTRNEMTVVEAWTTSGTANVTAEGYGPDASVVLSDPAAKDALVRLAAAGARCSTGWVALEGDNWVAHGEPMDAALDAFARRMGLDTDADRAAHKPIKRFAFDPRRRRMAVVVDGEILVKGAPDTVFPLCGGPDGAAAATLDDLTTKGLRVLAVAGKPWNGPVPETVEDAESGLTLYGVLALEDPPREGVGPALEACRRAGIKVAMLTGDHPATATAIATKVGLRGPHDLVLTGDMLPPDDAVLGALLDRDGVVVARVTPEDKLRIASALHGRGHVIAMTGDGVNDAPALHEADIGVAMGRSGTDVAREAADLVLLDDHFASIVAGVEQGRATYVNIRRFLTYHLTDNVAELTPFVVWALSGARFPLALGVLQILALDLGTDTMSAVALGAEPPGRHVLEGPPVSGRLLDWTVARRAFGLLGPVIALMTMIAFVVSLVALGWRPGDDFPTGHELAKASGAAFMTVVLGQGLNAFACRSSTRTPGELGWTTNRLLIPAKSIELGFALFVLFVGPVARELDQASPPLAGWLVALASIPVMFGVDWLDKHRRRRRASTAVAGPTRLATPRARV